MANGNASALALGPGLLYVAPLGTTMPTDHTTPLDAAFTPIGYTEEGSEVSSENSFEEIEVAEEIDPILNRQTKRSTSITFAMAEITVRNLSLAFNGGTVTSTATGIQYDPPDPSEVVRRIIVWESDDKTERHLFRQVLQTGSITMARRKGATKTTIPVQFNVELPAAGGKPYSIFADEDIRGGGVEVTPVA